MFTEESLTQIRKAKEKWEKENSETFAQERKQTFTSEQGLEVKRLYTPLDLAERGFDYLRDLGLPGEYPYTRGISPNMYRGALWSYSQYSGYPTPEQSNELWKRQIAAGENLVYIAYDLPTQLGYDPDNPRVEGEVGRVGVSLTSLRDWEVAFDGIDIEKVLVSQVLNAPGAIGIACHLALAEKRGTDLKKLRGICQNEILKEYISRGNYIFPPAPSVRLVVDCLAYCGRHVPNYQPIQVSSYHPSERGATPVHEAAFALATAFAYIQSATDRGISVDLVAPGMQFLTAHRHIDFFHEIAKLRAMRRIYARVLRDRFQAKNPQSMMARWYSAINGTSLQREQYLNNIARIALGVLVGALAGCQVIDTRAYDEQFGIPTVEALVTSARCQQVVAHETGVGDTVDPLGGSYFVETLTNEFEEAITKELDTIDKLGGMTKAIEQGYCQRLMAQDAYQWQRAFERGEMLRVGVNCFTSEVEERPARIYRADPKIEEQRIAAVKQMRRGRDDKKVEASLKKVKAMASTEATEENNMLPSILEAVKAYATVGEMCDTLREVWGEYLEPSVL